MKTNTSQVAGSEAMGSSNETQKAVVDGQNNGAVEIKTGQKRTISNLSHHSLSSSVNKDMSITTNIDGSKVTFTVLLKNNLLQIKSLNDKGKKFISSYHFDQLPKAIQVTYKSMDQLFQDIKYIIDEQVPNRLSLDKNGKIIFTLETKKKGKPQYLPQMFDMEQESGEMTMMRLQEEIQQLKAQDIRKQQRIDMLQQRLQQVEKMLLMTTTNNQANNNYINGTISPRMINTQQTSTNNNDQTLVNSSSVIQKDPQQSIIKKFKRSKSTENLQLTTSLEKSEEESQSLLKTTIGDYDVFVQYEEGEDIVVVEILSRKEAKIYKCQITAQTIPKEVYSFVPTPKKLHDQIAYIIKNNLKNRLDVQNNNFIYKASINTKNQQTLVDGVFETQPVKQDQVERIQGLVDLRASAVEERVKEIQKKVEMLKESLQSNDIILEMPTGFVDSKIIQTNAQFITLCKFFKNKIFKISLLYRASQNNFQIKKFHELCNNIPNTLTLIWTEFDKVIGGFTSQQWDKNGNSKPVSDYAGHSFIFSLTNRHKFTLEQHEYAIQTGAEDGPRFGNGADLVIKDKANENNNSYANICTSYNHPRYIYKNSESYKLFSGDDKTNRFGIKQWQVFEVFFQQ